MPESNIKFHMQEYTRVDSETGKVRKYWAQVHPVTGEVVDEKEIIVLPAGEIKEKDKMTDIVPISNDGLGGRRPANRRLDEIERNIVE